VTPRNCGFGVMCEVVTPKGDEAWLINILKTWQFN